METILEYVKFIEKYPVLNGFILTLAAAGIAGIVKVLFSYYNERIAYQYVKPSYWGLSKNFNINTVLEFFPDSNSSGYTQRQYSRPELWKTVVIKVSFFGIYRKIVPIEENSMLNVQVRRKRKSKDIYFNKIV
ncbi:hypothetical protein HGB47_16500 [Leptospira yasudae]|uniref:hypothetical protein n=1 Tax=Leptospira yasudae TaxID=2202201 RepID=UPI001C4E5A3A|nr:hypothetical protein [Leptospira yasudae]MBW0435214.1 hypothetical protein [Leptospira yasudae]